MFSTYPHEGPEVLAQDVERQLILLARGGEAPARRRHDGGGGATMRCCVLLLLLVFSFCRRQHAPPAPGRSLACRACPRRRRREAAVGRVYVCVRCAMVWWADAAARPPNAPDRSHVPAPRLWMEGGCCKRTVSDCHRSKASKSPANAAVGVLVSAARQSLKRSLVARPPARPQRLAALLAPLGFDPKSVRPCAPKRTADRPIDIAHVPCTSQGALGSRCLRPSASSGSTTITGGRGRESRLRLHIHVSRSQPTHDA